LEFLYKLAPKSVPFTKETFFISHEVNSNNNKGVSIKEEVQKLLKAGFIYLVSLTKWVSNSVLVN